MNQDKKTKFMRAEERKFGKMDLDLYVQYFKAVKGLWFFIVVAFVLLVMTSFSESVFRYFVAVWVDECKGNQCSTWPILKDIDSWLGQASSYHVVVFFMAFCLVATLVKSINWMFFLGFLAHTAKNLHGNMVTSLGHVRITFFDENPSGRLVRRFSNDYTQMKDEIPNVLSDIISSIFELIVIALFVIFQTPWSAIGLLPCGVIYYRMQNLFKAAAREAQRYTKIMETPLWSLFSETVVGYQTIRAYGRTENFLESLKHRIYDYGQAALFQGRLLRWLNVRLKLISETFSLCVAISVIYLIATKSIGVGTAGFLMSLTLGMDEVMRWLTRSLSMIDAKMVSVERVLEYRHLPPEETTSHRQKILPRVVALETTISAPQTALQKSAGITLTFENFTASYRDDLPDILHNINLTFPKGQRIGLVGRTGSGKSTIFQALYQMVYVKNGCIRANGIDLASLPIAEGRSLFAIVPQDPHLFYGSLRMNLDRAGMLADELLWRALEEVQMADFVRSLPQGLETILLERGSNFSLGQRQLLCMARTILLNRPVVLMDEATASVDPKTDQLIQHATEKLFAGKTVLIIAHRLDTVQKVDQLVTLENGHIILKN